MISKWFLVVITLTLLSSVMAILIRTDRKKEIRRLEDGELSADDFDIIE
jgi:hypothetical protein